MSTDKAETSSQLLVTCRDFSTIPQCFGLQGEDGHMDAGTVSFQTIREDYGVWRWKIERSPRTVS
jgi:hypothetical protein